MVRLYNAPCKCCGSPGHGLLTQEEEEGEVKVKLGCPASRTHGGDLTTQFAQGTFSFSAVPEAFATACGNDPESVMKVLVDFEKQGNGGIIGREGLTEFKEAVWKIVEERRASWTFKRVLMDEGGSLQSLIRDDECVNPNIGHQNATKVRIFCDLDGVLADFEEGVRRIFNREPKTISNNQLWSTLVRQPNFYGNLPWMKDGKLLWNAIKHLKPVIITAAPKGSWAGGQKRDWVRKNLGEEIQVIISTRKYEYCPPDPPMAILIDDRMSNCESWEITGGLSILHESTMETIERLQQLGCDVRVQDKQGHGETKETRG